MGSGCSGPDADKVYPTWKDVTFFFSACAIRKNNCVPIARRRKPNNGPRTISCGVEKAGDDNGFTGMWQAMDPDDSAVVMFNIRRGQSDNTIVSGHHYKFFWNDDNHYGARPSDEDAGKCKPD